MLPERGRRRLVRRLQRMSLLEILTAKVRPGRPKMCPRLAPPGQKRPQRWRLTRLQQRMPRRLPPLRLSGSRRSLRRGRRVFGLRRQRRQLRLRQQLRRQQLLLRRRLRRRKLRLRRLGPSMTRRSLFQHRPAVLTAVVRPGRACSAVLIFLQISRVQVRRVAVVVPVAAPVRVAPHPRRTSSAAIPESPTRLTLGRLLGPRRPRLRLAILWRHVLRWPQPRRPRLRLRPTSGFKRRRDERRPWLCMRLKNRERIRRIRWFVSRRYKPGERQLRRLGQRRTRGRLKKPRLRLLRLPDLTTLRRSRLRRLRLRKLQRRLWM